MPNANIIGAMIKNSAPATAIQGNKTYIISAFMVAFGLYVIVFGEAPTYANPAPMDPGAGLELILQGLGLGGLRAGVAKV